MRCPAACLKFVWRGSAWRPEVRHVLYYIGDESVLTSCKRSGSTSQWCWHHIFQVHPSRGLSNCRSLTLLICHDWQHTPPAIIHFLVWGGVCWVQGGHWAPGFIARLVWAAAKEKRWQGMKNKGMYLEKRVMVDQGIKEGGTPFFLRLVCQLAYLKLSA